MKHISLYRLEIYHFKGIKHLEIYFQGKDARISGRNASGKSSVYDAVLWLLFGRDSRNAANADFKPLDGDGKPVIGAEPTVTATLTIDGKQTVLRRALTEVWATPKGQAEKVYTGDKGAYWIDDVPKSEGDYKRFVASLLPEARFRLITNYEEFMGKSTQEKRLVLLGIADNGVDEILSKRFPEIVAALDGLIADDARKKYRTQKAKLDDELAGIPGRIDELNRQIEGADEADRKRLAAEADRLGAEIACINTQLAIDPKAILRADLARVNREIADMEADAQKKHKAARTAALDRKLDADNAAKKARRAVDELDGVLPKMRTTFDANAAKIDNLRADYSRVYESKYAPPDVSDTCPTCKQPLPANQIETAMERAFEGFTWDKERQLDKITADGEAIKLANDHLGAVIAENEADLAAARIKLAAAEKEQDAATAAFDALPEAVTYPPECAALVARADAIHDQLDIPEGESIAILRAKLAASEELRKFAQIAIARCDAVRDAKNRKADLETQQRELGDKAVSLNQRLMLVDDYVRERCRMLEESINAKFSTVKWRLFEELKGEGFKDVCTCMIPSDAGALVPYASANTGARVNAGMEIINVLSEAYGVAAPVFVENSESVDRVTPTTGQQIRLHKPDPEECTWEGLKVEFYERSNCDVV